jgi:hypothetical protein
MLPKAVFLSAILLIIGCGERKDVALAECTMDAARLSLRDDEQPEFIDNCMLVAGYEPRFISTCVGTPERRTRYHLCWEPKRFSAKLTDLWVELTSGEMQ